MFRVAIFKSCRFIGFVFVTLQAFAVVSFKRILNFGLTAADLRKSRTMIFWKRPFFVVRILMTIKTSHFGGSSFEVFAVAGGAVVSVF